MDRSSRCRSTREHPSSETRCGAMARQVSRRYEVGILAAYAEVAQLVEHNLAKVGVAGSSPVFRSELEAESSADTGAILARHERRSVMMRAALTVVIVEAALLVALALLQFETSQALTRNGTVDPTLDPLSDPLISNVRWIQVVLWLAAPPLIGVLVARARGRALLAAGLAVRAGACAVV